MWWEKWGGKEKEAEKRRKDGGREEENDRENEEEEDMELFVNCYRTGLCEQVHHTDIQRWTDTASTVYSENTDRCVFTAVPSSP